jgi:hypothetical protein
MPDFLLQNVRRPKVRIAHANRMVLVVAGYQRAE